MSARNRGFRILGNNGILFYFIRLLKQFELSGGWPGNSPHAHCFSLSLCPPPLACAHMYRYSLCIGTYLFLCWLQGA